MIIRDLRVGDWFKFNKNAEDYDYNVILQHHQEQAELVVFNRQGKCLGLRILREDTEIEYLGAI